MTTREQLWWGSLALLALLIVERSCNRFLDTISGAKTVCYQAGGSWKQGANDLVGECVPKESK